MAICCKSRIVGLLHCHWFLPKHVDYGYPIRDLNHNKFINENHPLVKGGVHTSLLIDTMTNYYVTLKILSSNKIMFSFDVFELPSNSNPDERVVIIVVDNNNCTITVFHQNVAISLSSVNAE